MIMGWVPILINFSFMLYLSVGTIPPLQTEAEIKGMALSMLFGAALLGAGVLLFTRIGKSRTAATA